MSFNPYTRLRALLPGDRLEIGTVVSSEPGRVVVTLPGGGRSTVIGDAQIGAQVYIRGGRIDGLAPSLPVVEIDV
jgi:hypothetical protein